MNGDSPVMSQTAGWVDAITGLSQADRASWAIQRQLTARGVGTLRMPRGIVVGFASVPISELAFMGFQGPGTTLVGTSLTAHASSVTEILSAKNLPAQPGRVCSTKQLQRATSYARSVGYPVIVRPANSDRVGRPRIVVRTAGEMAAALERIQVEASDRTVDREPAARTAWVQKAPTGKLLRILVAGSEAIAAVEGHPETQGFEPTPVSEIQPDIRGIAVAALRAFPGVEHGEVDLVVQSSTQIARPQDVAVMNIGASPVLDTYQSNGDYGAQVVAVVTDHYLTKSGVDFSEASDLRHVKITYTGVVNLEKFAGRLKSMAEKFSGTKGTVETGFSGEDRVSAIFEGPPDTAALLSIMGVRGLSRRQRASTAFTEVFD